MLQSLVGLFTPPVQIDNPKDIEVGNIHVIKSYKKIIPSKSSAKNLNGYKPSNGSDIIPVYPGDIVQEIKEEETRYFTAKLTDKNGQEFIIEIPSHDHNNLQ